MEKIKKWKIGFIFSTILASLGIITVVILCCVFCIEPKARYSKTD